MKRIFSGVQPSGNLHIGNYLGAIKNWVRLQDDYSCIFCVVDLHAITVPQDPQDLRKQTLEVAKILIASGIDPKKSTLFIQSHIPEHTELTWILNTIAKISELERMTQFKDKAGKNREGVDVGLFDYPVLMAADILLYDTDIVPVGEDQIQHIEITRTLAKRFNQRFGETFIIPEPYVTKEGMRIMGLDDPTKKMAKSAASEYNYIALLDDPDKIRKKIQKAVTDSGREVVYRDDKPALKNLIEIYSSFSGKTVAEIEKLYTEKSPASTRGGEPTRGGYANFKKDLAEVIIEKLEPIQEKYHSFSDEKILDMLKTGAEKVRLMARKKLDEVKNKMGLVL